MRSKKNHTVYNTFRMKVRCALYVEVTAESDLRELDWEALPQPVFVIGGGSNLLFTQEFFPGTVLHVAYDGETPFRGTPFASLTPAPPTAKGPGLGISSHPSLISVGPSPYPCPGVDMSPEGSLFVSVPAGVVFDDFCAWAAKENLWGPENLSLIPGEVGASAVQNIGAYGVEAKDIIAGIRAWDRVERCFVDIVPADCEYGYRTSKFKTVWKGRFIITTVTYRLSREPKPVLDYGGVRKALELNGVRDCSSGTCPPPDMGRGRGPFPKGMGGAGAERSEAEFPEEQSLTPQIIRDTIIGIRRQKLPAVEEMGSAGSFFCNPVVTQEHFNRIVQTAREDNGPDYEVPHYDVPDGVKVPAAWMIEQCGFKGKRSGGAQVYPKQPLVIVNESGEASAKDILALETEIIETISAKYGITLHPEVEHI